MKFWEAMREMQENGKKVRCTHPDWKKDEYLKLDDKNWIVDELGFDASCLANGEYVNAKWEIYQQPDKTYTFMEILPMLKEGRKVRRKSWMSPHAKHLQALDININLQDLEANDWIEVKDDQ